MLDADGPSRRTRGRGTAARILAAAAAAVALAGCASWPERTWRPPVERCVRLDGQYALGRSGQLRDQMLAEAVCAASEQRPEECALMLLEGANVWVRLVGPDAGQLTVTAVVGNRTVWQRVLREGAGYTCDGNEVRTTSFAVGGVSPVGLGIGSRSCAVRIDEHGTLVARCGTSGVAITLLLVPIPFEAAQVGDHPLAEHVAAGSLRPAPVLLRRSSEPRSPWREIARLDITERKRGAVPCVDALLIEAALRDADGIADVEDSWGFWGGTCKATAFAVERIASTDDEPPGRVLRDASAPADDVE